MILRLPSGSKLSLGMKCMGSFILPQVSDEPGPVAEEGNVIHAKLEKYIESGRKKPEGEGDREFFERFDKSIPLIVGSYESPERGLSVDARAASCDAFDLATRPGEDSVRDRFVCVADLVQQHSERRFSVWDYKSSGWVPDPEWNWQLIVAGIGLYLCVERDPSFSCELGICYTGQPTDDGAFKTSARTFDAAFFEDRLAKLQRLQERAERATPETVRLYEGKHCLYCPARARCPAKIGALANALIAASYEGDMKDVDIVAAALTLVDSKPQLDKAMRSILKEHGGQLDLGDGRVAVLEVTEKNGKIKEKVYTKHAKQEARPDAPEDGEPGAEG